VFFMKSYEAALPMNQSHSALRDHVRKALQTAHNVGDSYYSSGPYITDMFPGHVVYSFNGETHKRTYSVTQGAEGTDPKITLGEPKKVHVAYVDTKNKESRSVLLPIPFDFDSLQEASVIITDEVPVRESAIFCETIEDIKEAARTAAATGKATTIPVKIIGPGWGSSAYYSKEMIQKTGPGVFKKGTQMFWNHATSSQESERPEGDLNDLAAVFTEDAKWDDNGLKGPGLYTRAKVFSDYATQVEEKGAHIGVSINALVKAHEGEAEGKRGRLADSFVHAFSTDFVTKAGAGGAPIVPALESARTNPQKENVAMTDQEAQVLQTENTTLKTRITALEADNRQLSQGQNQIVAMAAVNGVLRESGVQISQELLQLVCQNPTVKEGKIDPEWIKGVAAAFITKEGGGKVVGMGGTASVPAKEGDLKKDAEAAFSLLGMSKEALAFATEGF
jgi:hypothetical protein